MRPLREGLHNQKPTGVSFPRAGLAEEQRDERPDALVLLRILHEHLQPGKPEGRTQKGV